MFVVIDFVLVVGEKEWAAKGGGKSRWGSRLVVGEERKKKHEEITLDLVI